MANFLVTGASRGIGLQIAKQLASKGHGITLCARNKKLLIEQLRKLPTDGESQKHDIWSLDMADLEAVANTKDCPRPLNNYDGFINSAGIARTGLLIRMPKSSIQEVLNVNLTAPILLAKKLSLAMLSRKEKLLRHLIFISSIAGSKGLPGSTVYGASKAGIEGFARGLAREIGSRDIAVNCIAPALVESDMGINAGLSIAKDNIFPGYISQESIAKAVLFLIESKHITGQTLVVDSGNTA